MVPWVFYTNILIANLETMPPYVKLKTVLNPLKTLKKSPTP